MATLYVNGCEIHYEQAGTGEVPVLFVHGFSCDGTDWRHQQDHLALRCTTVTLDLNGHGRSGTDLENCTIKGFSDDVITLAERLGLNQVTLVGHSMGCRVVLQALSKRSDLFKAAVLVDGGRLTTVETLDVILTNIQEMLKVVGYQEFVKHMFEHMFLHSSDPHLKEAIIKRAQSLPEEVGLRIADELFRWDALELEKALSATRAPILIIQSTDDSGGQRSSLKTGESSPWLDLLSAHLKPHQLDVTVIPDTGHFIMLEHSAEVNRLLDTFLLS